MSNYTGPISLEAALGGILDNDFESQFDSSADTSVIMGECLDLFIEMHELQENVTVFEAAKTIKKATSSKKKVKTKTTKMTAKAAKAKKAGGKVVKIRREDDDIEPDLDADPDATVEVTEVDEDGADQEDIIGTEGVDFIVEYEDAAIVQLEAAEAEQKKKFGTKFIEGVKKFVDWVVAFVMKIINFFRDNEKFLEKNKEIIEKGMTMDDVKVKIRSYPKGLGSTITFVGDMIDKLGKFNFKDPMSEDLATLITSIMGNANRDYRVYHSENIDFTKMIKDMQKLDRTYIDRDAGFIEVPITKSDIYYDEAKNIFKLSKDSETLKKLNISVFQQIKRGLTLTKKVKDDRDGAISEAMLFDTLAAITNSCIRLISCLAADASTVIRKAAKAGGASK